MVIQSFRSLDDDYQVAEISFDEKHLWGEGDIITPRLILPIKLHLNGEGISGEYALLHSNLLAVLHLSSYGKISSSVLTQFETKALYHKDDVWRPNFQIEFPLDSARLDLIERVRNGGDLKLELSAQLTVTEYVFQPTPNQNSPKAWIPKRIVPIKTTFDHVFEIPHTQWIKLLKKIGYGVIRLFEMPVVSEEACKELKLSYAALEKAERDFKKGEYGDAVGKCRIALEPFFGRNKTVPEDVWQAKVGDATYKWLSDALHAIWDDSHPPHHSLPSYSRLDAQMILVVTISFINYNAHLFNNQEKKTTPS